MKKYFDLQGHRGCRGLMPENSIPAFRKALELGVKTLEMDVVISGDNQVVVSHDPYMSSEFCLHPDGKPISKDEEKSLNIYRMDYETVKKYDCGSSGNSRFPGQERQKVYKPLLSEVIADCEKYSEILERERPFYNIEIKSEPEKDDIYHPKPDIFSKLVYQIIEEALSFDQVCIQSFDLRILKYWKQNYPFIKLALLVENDKSVDANLSDLGFKPNIYSPFFKLLKKEDIIKLHQNGVMVTPWTVNSVSDMKNMIDLDVDGLITDYPDLFLKEFG